MDWNYRDDLPIYSQLVEKLKIEIANGGLKPGERLPSVRDLALEAGVNPNTMQRALSDLEQQGLVKTQRTSGRFVTDDTACIGRAAEELAKQQIRQYLAGMAELGFTRDQAIGLLENFTEEK